MRERNTEPNARQSAETSAPEPKAEPHSVSWNEGMDRLITARRTALKMNLSEYFRHCVRLEAEQSHARKLSQLIGQMPDALAA